MHAAFAAVNAAGGGAGVGGTGTEAARNAADMDARRVVAGRRVPVAADYLDVVGHDCGSLDGDWCQGCMRVYGYEYLGMYTEARGRWLAGMGMLYV